MQIVHWLTANPYEAFGIVYLALGGLNAILPHKGDEASALRRLLDWMAPLVPAKFSGTLKVPGRSSLSNDPPDVPPTALAMIVAVSLGACDRADAAVCVALAAGFASAALLVRSLRRYRSRRLADASDDRERETPHLTPLSDEHARAMASAIEAKAKRRRGHSISCSLALACLSLSACAPAWQTGAALVASAHVAVTGYQRYTHDARRSILAASGCSSAPACEAALVPFELKQAPALACLSALAPLVEGAALAAEAKDVKAAAAILPDLGAKVPACVAAIQQAKR